jgi:transcriptional regulator with XRE-family HTH domain
MAELDPAQVRAARALLDWTQPDLAKAAHIALATVKRFERGLRTPIPNNLAAIRLALESAGVKFIDRGKSGGPGVRLIK